MNLGNIEGAGRLYDALQIVRMPHIAGVEKNEFVGQPKLGQESVFVTRSGSYIFNFAPVRNSGDGDIKARDLLSQKLFHVPPDHYYPLGILVKPPIQEMIKLN